MSPEIETEWRASPERDNALLSYVMRLAESSAPLPETAEMTMEGFQLSPEFREARLKFKKRTGGHTKADH